MSREVRAGQREALTKLFCPEELSEIEMRPAETQAEAREQLPVPGGEFTQLLPAALRSDGPQPLLELIRQASRRTRKLLFGPGPQGLQ
jgi:hypothetical protein